MARVNKVQIDEAIANFQYEGMLIDERPYGNGHINDTFLLTFEIAEMGRIKVILQRMNKEVFTNPVELMENIIGDYFLSEKKDHRKWWGSRQGNIKCNTGCGWETVLC